MNAATTAGLAVAVAAMVSAPLAWWLSRGGHRVEGDVGRVPLASSWWTVPISGVLAGVAGWWLPAPVLVPVVVAIVAGVLVSWVDIDVQRIPNRILLVWAPAQLLVLVWAVWQAGDLGRMLPVLYGTAVFGGLFLLLATVGTMGMGDVKLACICGGLLGFIGWPTTVLWGIFLSAVFGGIGGLVVRRVQGPGTFMAYGPAIVAGTLVAVAFS